MVLLLKRLRGLKKVPVITCLYAISLTPADERNFGCCSQVILNLSLVVDLK